MKSIAKDKSTITPFRVYKSQNYTQIYASTSSVSPVFVDVGEAPPDGWQFDPDTDPRNPDGIYSYPLHDSIKNLFYNTASFWDASAELFSASVITRGYEPSSSICVINIPQSSYGEGVYPGSFKITTTGTASINDDGRGHLYYGTNSGSFIGNIFYNIGIAVLDRIEAEQVHLRPPFSPLVQSGSIFPLGMYVVTGSVLEFSFKASHTIYEHRVVCTLNPAEFNYPTNPTVNSGSTLSGEHPFALVASGTLRPYVTTIGLYNDNQELLAIGKFPRPIKRVDNTEQVFIIRFDA